MATFSFYAELKTFFLNRTPLLPYLQLLYQGFGGLNCPDLTIIALSHWTEFKLHEAIMPVPDSFKLKYI